LVDCGVPDFSDGEDAEVGFSSDGIDVGEVDGWGGAHAFGVYVVLNVFVVDGEKYAAAVGVAIGGHEVVEDWGGNLIWEVIHDVVDVTELEVHDFGLVSVLGDEGGHGLDVVAVSSVRDAGPEGGIGHFL
jgi:hypothetical protein